MKLKSLKLEGFKSINQDGQTIGFGDVTILLGANGVGKSNLVSFFKMLNNIMTGSLQTFIAEGGFADAFLHYGSKKTNKIKCNIEFSDDSASDYYDFTLANAAGGILIFTEELLTYHVKGEKKPHHITISSGVKESELRGYSQKTNITANDKIVSKSILTLLKGFKVFQFHDTSQSSRVRLPGYTEDNHFLGSDGGNLAAFLYALKNDDKNIPYYNRIIRHIQLVMPQFLDFELTPSSQNPKYISLNWKDTQNDYLFGPHQISDGSLRFMALATLLLQPPKSLPSVIILDEPELGLHPSAIAYLGGMIKVASRNAQIIMATQSPRLVDEFEAQNVVIIERNNDTNSSEFKQLSEEGLGEWLERYSLSELWEKNVIGGQP